jgi:dihydrofolate reductase
MRRSIIAAVAANGVIGRDNRMPWHLPPDLKRFKALTLGHDLIMGRRTFDSIGRPLPGRRTILLTRNPAYSQPDVVIASTLDEAFALARGEEVFVAGGAEVYRQALDRTDRMYLTRIEHAFDGDATFPSFAEEEWALVMDEPHQGEEWVYRFLIYDRVR